MSAFQILDHGANVTLINLFDIAYLLCITTVSLETRNPFYNNIMYVCWVAWSLNESEAGVDLVLIEISLLFLC